MLRHAGQTRAAQAWPGPGGDSRPLRCLRQRTSRVEAHKLDNEPAVGAGGAATASLGSDSTSCNSNHSLSRRSALAGAAVAAAGSLLHPGPLGAPAAAAAAAEQQSAVLLVPHVPLAPSCPQLSISRVIKGCWQLSGGHRGERETDRTTGAAAVEVRARDLDKTPAPCSAQTWAAVMHRTSKHSSTLA